MKVLDSYWKEIQKIPTLTSEAEEVLADRIQEGDEFALDELVTANLRYIVAIARQFSESSQFRAADILDINMDDLISEGNMAMLVAARKWDPSRGIRFAQYAAHDIRKAMQRCLPDQYIIKKDAHDERLKAGKPMTDDHVMDTELNHAMAIAMRRLNEREQLVIRYYYGISLDDKMTMGEIAERMGVTRERVRQIRKTAERKMRRIIRKDTELDIRIEEKI